MPLREETFVGPPIEDAEILERLPAALREGLTKMNGAVRYSGGLHIRGACHEPPWHSLRRVWVGDKALHVRYPAVVPTDIPFAQDALGDQFLLRDDVVHRLSGETGETESLAVGLEEFLAAADADPVEHLGLEPLVQFIHEGGALEPGYLLNAYPPFCTKESGAGVTLRAVPADEQLDYLAELSTQLAALEPGATFEFKFVD
jgi:hypothetical protein